MNELNTKNFTHTKEFASEATSMIYELLEASIKLDRPAMEQFLRENDIDQSLLESLIEQTRKNQRIQLLQRFKIDADFRKTITQLVISRREMIAKGELEQNSTLTFKK